MKFNILVGLFVVALCNLCGCGGGGGGSDGTPTAQGTTVNLSAFKNVYLGTSAGTQYSFPALFGSDSQGRSWSGSFSIVGDGATTFESQDVTKQRSLITLQMAGGTPVSGTTTAYFLSSNGNPYKSVSSLGVTFTPTSLFTIPSTAKVGDFGDLGTDSGSDGTTTTGTWTLNAGNNGASILAFSSLTKTGTLVTSTEVDSIYLDASGNPTMLAISVTASGLTVNLSGAKN